jgi:hypothetical protein
MQKHIPRVFQKQTQCLALFKQAQQTVNCSNIANNIKFRWGVVLAVVHVVFWIVVAGFVALPSSVKAADFAFGDVVVDERNKFMVANNYVAYPISLEVDFLADEGFGYWGNSVVPFFAFGNAQVAAPSKVNTEAECQNVSGNNYDPVLSIAIYFHFLVIALNVAWILYVTEFTWHAKEFLLTVLSKFTQ